MAVPQQLPRGRHGLSRKAVKSDQRERMLRAMCEAVAERGYVKTPVAEVLRRAGVSRETFYEHFSNKQQCFLAAFDFSAQTVMHALGDTLGPLDGEMTEERVRAVLDRYLQAIADEPAAARTFFVEVYAAGRPAIQRRSRIQSNFVEGVSFVLGARTEQERFACEVLVAGISMLTTQKVAAGAFDELHELRDPFAELIAAALDGR